MATDIDNLLEKHLGNGPQFSIAGKDNQERIRQLVRRMWLRGIVRFPGDNLMPKQISKQNDK